MAPTAQFKFQSDYEAAKPSIGAGANDLILYALSYYLDVSPESLAADVTDGGGDQSSDLVHFDTENSRAIIAQGTEEKEWFKSQASTTKAASLGQAVNWLLVASLKDVPERILPKAVELRKLIDTGEVDTVEIVFIHNALDSKSVKNELEVVAKSAARINDAVSFRGIELGANAIEELFLAATSLISVREKRNVPIKGLMQFSGGARWSVVLATVPASAIFDLYEEYGDRLFSANVRDYLGTKKSTKNINNVIKETATSRGADFFVLNNGITILSNSLELSGDGRMLMLDGVSVINGAQTTGALHEAGAEACASIAIQCRFLQSDDKALLEDAVRYNNTQNAVRASDRKSTDAVQMRLVREFGQVGLKYAARRSRTLSQSLGYKIEADSVAQALCSFRGDLTVATRNRSSIWDDKAQYERVFPENIPWNNVWLVHLLSVALDTVVSSIRTAAKTENATESERRQLMLLSFSTSKQAIIFLFGSLREVIMKRSVSDYFMWCAKPSTVSDRKADLIVALGKALGRIISRVANTKRDEAEIYNLVRTQSQLERLSSDLITYFEDFFEDAEYIQTIRELTYIQTT